MKIHIRAVTPEDHQFLYRLSRAAHEVLATRLFGSWDDTAQRARLESNLQRYAFRIIEVERQPIGAIASTEHEDHVFLNEMMILPELQNRGIGSAVLLLEIGSAQSRRMPLRLHTSRLSRAKDLYKRHGFIETGRNDKFVDMERPFDSAAVPSDAERQRMNVALTGPTAAIEYDSRMPSLMTSPLAALITPHGAMRTRFACAELDTSTTATADSARTATGATRVHFRHPAAEIDLTVGEIRPRMPSQMTVLGCCAGLWRVTARQRLSTLRFECEWPAPPPGAEGGPNSGEGLDALTWRLADSALSLGTEDGEFLAARATRDATVPPRLSSQLTFSTVACTDSGLVVPISGLYPGEAVEIHFIVAWTDGYSDESPSTWFAVDQAHSHVVASLIGTEA